MAGSRYQVRVASGRFALGHLGELTQQVPFNMVDAILAEAGAVQRRIRDLPARCNTERRRSSD
jgi:transposase IS4-like protein